MLTFQDLEAGKGSEAQQKAWQEYEWRRCESDAVYFLDKYGYIVDEGRITKWHLWPIQKMIARDLCKGQSIVGVKARQLGITTTVSHLALWDCLFHEAEVWDNISASEEKAKDILKRVQATKDRLPKWMLERAESRAQRDGKTRRKDKADSITRIAFGHSEMKIATSTVRSIQGASSNINLDEATLHTDLKRKLQQMMATLDGGGGTGAVIANGNGQDDFFWFYTSAKNGTNGFKPYFFWWGDDPSRLEGAVVHQQNGKDVPVVVPDYDEAPDHYIMWRINLMRSAEAGNLEAPWYETMKLKFLMDNPEADEFAFRAVYPTNEQEAFFISANSRFRLAIVNGIAERIRGEEKEGVNGRNYIRGYIEPNSTGGHDIEVKHTGRWKVFQPPQAGAKYVMGMDSSGGSNAGDYAVAQIGKLLGQGHVEQVAVFRAKCEPTELALEGLKAGGWYNDAYAIPEANNTGILLIDYMKADYYNLYIRKVRTDRAIYNGITTNIGFWTDKASKPKLIGQLAEWLNKGKVIIHDADTVDELGHYEIKEDGVTTGAPKGMNDDCVMALALMVEGAIDLETFHVDAEPRIIMPWED